MWNASRKFLRLPWESKRFVLQTALILPVVYAGLELFGLKRVLAGMARLTRVDEQRRNLPPAYITNYTDLFSSVARHCPLPLKCLGRSVALCCLLRRRGIDAAVHIGVRKEQEGGLDAHAWVQRGDVVLNDTENVAQRYTRVVPDYSGMNNGR